MEVVGLGLTTWRFDRIIPLVRSTMKPVAVYEPADSVSNDRKVVALILTIPLMARSRVMFQRSAVES